MSVPPATEHRTDRLIITELVGRFASASNATFLGEDPDGVLWVYKPAAGVGHLWDFGPDSLANREIMAYEVSTWMGLDLIPETVEASGPLGPGAAQRYLDPDPDFDYRGWFEDQLNPRLWPVAVFDLAANNADRKAGHCLYETARIERRERTAYSPLTPRPAHMWAIDHGICFHHQYKLRTVIWEFAGETIEGGLLADLESLQDLVDTGPVHSTLGLLLSAPELDALRRRISELLTSRQYPSPPVHQRNYPWPPI